MGINGAAKAGDDFLILDSEKEAKSLAEARAEESKEGKTPLTFATQESAFKDKRMTGYYDPDGGEKIYFTWIYDSN